MLHGPSLAEVMRSASMQPCCQPANPCHTPRSTDAHAAVAQRIATRVMPIVIQAVITELNTGTDHQVFSPRVQGNVDTSVNAVPETGQLNGRFDRKKANPNTEIGLPLYLSSKVTPVVVATEATVDSEIATGPISGLPSTEYGSIGDTHGVADFQSHTSTSPPSSPKRCYTGNTLARQVDHLFSNTSYHDITQQQEVLTKFSQLDPDNTGLVPIERIVDSDETGMRFGTRPSLKTKKMNAFKDAIVKLNDTIPEHNGVKDRMSLHSFKAAMMGRNSDIIKQVGRQHAKALLELKKMCFKDHDVNEKIAHLCQITAKDLNDETIRRQQSKKILGVKCSPRRCGEPLVAFVILANALTIGISLDASPNWKGWDFIEAFFSTFFVLELTLKLFYSGCSEHFLGGDWLWNWFDFIVVLLAVIDTGLSIINEFRDKDVVNFANFTVFRLFRLARIFRLVRLLRFKMFKELSLMLSGVLGGLRTLFWAMIFLLVVLYALGVMIRQIMDPANSSYDCAGAVANGLLLDDGTFAHGANCNRGAYKLDLFRDHLFKNVGRSMVTMFLCLTEGCTAPDGTPIVWYWWDSHGALLIVGYVFVYIFITFGIFNLILAIFVENTMASAHADERMRTSRRHHDHVRQGQKLRRLLANVCASDVNGNPTRKSSSKKGLMRHLENVAMKKKKKQEQDVEDVDVSADHVVTRREFEAALETDEVQSLLEDLDVSLSSQEHLFHILDADCSGHLQVKELLDGIMRLRGPADKGDAVSGVLMMRTLLDRMIDLKASMMQRQDQIMLDLEQLRFDLESDRSVVTHHIPMPQPPQPLHLPTEKR